jgi:hypothetical protein
MTAVETPAPPRTRPADRSPAPGYYLVPRHHGGVVERSWDGDVWTDETRPAPPGATLPPHRREPFGFLRSPEWILLVVYIAAIVICMVLVERDPHATRPSGITWLLPAFGFVATAVVMVGVAVYLDRRLRFDQVAERRAILGWGVLSGAVGVAVALLGEVTLPGAFGASAADGPWVWIAGPAEEAGKLLIPVVLWFVGRYRLPRQGFLLAVTSAATFGVIEATRYGLSPDEFTWSRGWGEVIHVLLTGFIAAVAWQAAWKATSWFTAAGIGALVLAMGIHSSNDAAVLASQRGALALGLATPLAVVVLYVLLKRSARQLVPPDNVGAVSPGWRPVVRARPASASS